MNHHSHSSLVRSWKPAKHTGVSTTKTLDWAKGERHTLKSPHEGYRVSVSFSCYPDHPQYVRIRATNWRAEHEPSGLFFKDDARAFYKTLLAAGFVKEE